MHSAYPSGYLCQQTQMIPLQAHEFYFLSLRHTAISSLTHCCNMYHTDFLPKKEVEEAWLSSLSQESLQLPAIPGIGIHNSGKLSSHLCLMCICYRILPRILRDSQEKQLIIPLPPVLCFDFTSCLLYLVPQRLQ